MNILTQIKKLSIASIIISIVLGIIFIAFPDKCLAYISLAVGIALIVLGIAGIINYFVDKFSVVTLFLGIVCAITGIVVCAKYQAIISFIVIIFGIFILASGIFNLVASIKIIASKFSSGWVTLVLSILTSALGIIAITKSGEFSVKIVQFIGVSLIVYAVLDIISFIQVMKLAKNVKSAFEATEDIDTQGTIIEES